jgi:hypothetical protein
VDVLYTILSVLMLAGMAAVAALKYKQTKTVPRSLIHSLVRHIDLLKRPGSNPREVMKMLGKEVNSLGLKDRLDEIVRSEGLDPSAS